MESFRKMWYRLSEYYEVKLQPNGIDKYMDTPDVLIYDNKAGFVKNYRVIKNHNSDWLNITFSNGRTITCTPDHPFETENRGVVQAKDLTKEDEIKIDTSSNFVDNSGISVDKNKAWYHGIVMFDSLYNEVFTWDKESRLNFVAGMIDTAGYFDVESEYKTAYLDFKDKKCAIQQMLLIQTLGIPVSITKSKTGYTIAFNPTKELIDTILLNQPEYEITTTKDIITDIVHLSSVESFTKQGFSYDVTTESEHFTVSGIYSHNCRSFLTPDRFTDAGIGNIANALNYKPNKHKYYGRSTILGCH